MKKPIKLGTKAGKVLYPVKARNGRTYMVSKDLIDVMKVTGASL